MKATTNLRQFTIKFHASFSLQSVGAMIAASAAGKLAAALDAYKASRGILEGLAKADPGSAGRRDIIAKLLEKLPDDEQLPEDLAWAVSRCKRVSLAGDCRRGAADVGRPNYHGIP